LALAVEDETVIRKERSGNSQIFIPSDVSVTRTYEYVHEFNLIDRQARFSRISIKFPLRLHWLRRRVASRRFNLSSDPGRFSRAIVPRLASRIDDGTRRYPVTVDNSRLRYRSYFSAVFAIAKQSQSTSTSFRRSGSNSGLDDASSTACLSRSFNESGISSILSPTTWRTVRNRIRTHCCILMIVPIAWPTVFPIDEVFDRMRNCSGNNSHSILPKRVTFISPWIIYFLEYFPIAVIFHNVIVFLEYLE